jgi:hypothetical protein
MKGGYEGDSEKQKKWKLVEACYTHDIVYGEGYKLEKVGDVVLI